MFVRIMRSGHETLHECERIAFHPEEGERYLTIIMEPSNIEIKIDTVDTEVYVMNNDGKTIDTHRWPVEPKAESDEPKPPTLTNDCWAVGTPLFRYSAGSEVGDYIGWYEPADKSWIMFVDKNHCGWLFAERDPETGAVKE